ncbi:PilZ domain-containing protein [Catenovulum maritimum]|uniref:PilZ domain-containing protein n=1 Tax=Catenovulum maritimum TaxID=1513271 RepID=A0A0J8GRH4_9ALTE|nr:PilZ domain-containing protein [Catenovulum maritimum]KMT65302.1 hypothetical protein XM47_09720 [Catenovulum maritimum]
MIGHDDQRSYYRMMINAECILVVNSVEAPQQFNAICRDLSANGMAVEINQEIEAGEDVSVKINSTNIQIPSLTAKGKVLRSRKEADNLFVVGIEIIDLA